MYKKLILTVGIVAIVSGGVFLATKKHKIPFPPELEKERQEAQAEYEKLHESDEPWVKAGESSSDCPECAQVVADINNVANKRNAIYETQDKELEDARNLSDSLKLSLYNEGLEWDRVTDMVDVPSKSWWDRLFNNEGKIYDIVLPEDAELVKNPNKVIIPEDLLAHFRELQKQSEEIRVKIRASVLKRAELEKQINDVEQEYAKAIANFNSCTNGPSCKKKDEKASLDIESNIEEKFDTAILEVWPMEDFFKNGIHEISPNIYNRQKLGHADYASRTKFKIVSNVSCGKTEGIEWWERNPNNPMGIRWYSYECTDAGIAPKGDFKVEMYFDDKKFAVCEYNVPGGSKPCERFDK